MNTNKIIEKAKESYDRYFKDAPVFPENHEQDVVCNTEEIEKIIEKKKQHIDDLVENHNTLKKKNELKSEGLIQLERGRIYIPALENLIKR